MGGWGGGGSEGRGVGGRGAVVGEPTGAGVIYQQWPLHNNLQDELLSKQCF